jgi:hypothetical protein
VALLMISTMLAACSSADLVPPGAIDSGTQVGAIQPSRSLSPEPPSQPVYQASQAAMQQASLGSYGYPRNGEGDAYTGDPGHYLRLPDQASPAQGPGPSSQAMAAPQSNLSSGIPDEGVNMDEQFGFSPDESDVTGLAEEEADNIAEGVGDQPVVDGIGTDNPRALSPRRQPVSDDRVIVPPKRQAAGLQGDLASGSGVWNGGANSAPSGRMPAAGTQQVAMLRPNNPAVLSGPMSQPGPMSEPDQPLLRNAMPQSEMSCRAELRRLGVEFREVPRISNGGSCGIDYPVKLAGLSGNIDVKPAVTLNCQTTLAFAKWVKNELAPSARYRYLTGVQRIVPMGGYSCRRMNNSRQRYNPMSEHARGNAIDVGKIVLKNGHEIDVRKKGLFSFREGGLLKAVRTDSCKYFSTVLGPGSNAEHWNHFHFDLRSRKGSRRYCD